MSASSSQEFFVPCNANHRTQCITCNVMLSNTSMDTKQCTCCLARWKALLSASTVPEKQSCKCCWFRFEKGKCLKAIDVRETTIKPI